MLLIDAGNTRLKWRLVDGSVDRILAEGAGALDDSGVFAGLDGAADVIREVAVSTVGTDESIERLEEALAQRTNAAIRYHWSQRCQLGVTNSYADVSKMGADRWHGMTAGWHRVKNGLAIVDAGSAVTVDYVNNRGQHLGGYILPGLLMMRRSLKVDAARIGFEHSDVLESRPGNSTGECVNHGLAWLSKGMVAQIHSDAASLGLDHVLVTGGDAQRLLRLGLVAEHCPDLVFEGLFLAAVSGSDDS